MKIKKLQIENFRGIDKLSLKFNSNINVFIGENGMGKSTIVDALALLLSWIVLPLQRPSQKGENFSESDIKNGADFAKLKIDIADKNFKTSTVTWTRKIDNLFEATHSSINDGKDNRKDYINFLRGRYEDHEHSLPVIMYYQITRGGKNNKSHSSLFRHATSSIGIYDHALDGDPCFESFMDWLRDQNELKNHTDMQSQKEWLDANRSLFRRELDLLYRSIDNYRIRSNERSPMQDSYRRKRLEFIREKESWENPRQLIHEVIITCFHDELIPHNEEMMDISDALELFMFKMLDFAEYRSQMTESSGFFAAIFNKLLSNIVILVNSEKISKNELYLIWSILSFSVQISLWWTSSSCREKIRKVMLDNKFRGGDNFERFSFSEELTNEINHIIYEDIEQRKNLLYSEDYALKFINNALSLLLPEYKNIRVDLSQTRKTGRNSFDIYIEKFGERLSFQQLSTGEQTVIAMVGDIARRLVMANPKIDNPLHGYGAILIDELDLHLHPSWQVNILPLLSKTFPNCQFIVTTHSPLVLSRLEPEEIFVLSYDDENKIKAEHPVLAKGLSVTDILSGLMNEVSDRDDEADKMLKTIDNAIEDEDILTAKKQLEKLKKYLNGKITPEMEGQEAAIEMLEAEENI